MVGVCGEALGRALHELNQFVEKLRQPEPSGGEMAPPSHFCWTGGVAAWHSDGQLLTLAPWEKCEQMNYIPLIPGQRRHLVPWCLHSSNKRSATHFKALRSFGRGKAPESAAH